MAKQLLLSGVIVTGTTGEVFFQMGHSLVVIASATSWGAISRVLIECSADNKTTWVPCSNVIDGSDAVVDGDATFQIHPLGKDVYIRARALQIIGTTEDVAIYLSEVWT